MYSPPYISDQARRYAALYTAITSEAYRAFSTLGYKKHPVFFFVILGSFTAAGVFFLVWSIHAF